MQKNMDDIKNENEMETADTVDSPDQDVAAVPMGTEEERTEGGEGSEEKGTEGGDDMGGNTGGE